MYAGKLAEKASAGDDRRRAAPPVHADADRLAARGRRPLRGAPACRHRGTAAVAAPPARGLPFPRPLPARDRRCAAEPPYRSVGAGHLVGVLGGRRGADASSTSRSTIASARSAAADLCAVDDVSFSVERGRGRLADRRERQRQDDDRADGPRAAPGSAAARISLDGRDVAALRGAARKEYYRHVQGVFQDPFSSFNPIFKADHVFATVREGFFPHMSDAKWRAKLSGALEAVVAHARRRARPVPAPAERRPAAARARRAGAAARHRAARRGRDHQHARRVDAHRRVEPARRPEGARARDRVHHARPLARQLHQRRHGDPAARRASSSPARRREVFGNPQHDYTRMLLAAVPQLHRKWEAVPA